KRLSSSGSTSATHSKAWPSSISDLRRRSPHSDLLADHRKPVFCLSKKLINFDRLHANRSALSLAPRHGGFNWRRAPLSRGRPVRLRFVLVLVLGPPGSSGAPEYEYEYEYEIGRTGRYAGARPS